MKIDKFIIVFIFLCNTLYIDAQESNPWLLGVGLNTVDNSGSRFENLLDISNNWNFSKLLKISLEKRFHFDYGVEVSFALNKFNTGKTINSELNNQDTNYFSIDFMFKNYITNYFLDPKHTSYIGYLTGGVGGSFFNGIINKTLNLGLGLNYRIRYDIRVNIQTIGKFSLDDNTRGNASHLQHSISIIKWI